MGPFLETRLLMDVAGQPARPYSDGRSYASARIRFAVCLAAGALAGTAAALAGAGREAPLIGWSVLAAGFCAWIWAAAWPMDADATSAHARSESPGRDATDVLLLGAAVVSLVAVGFVLFGAGSQHGSAKVVQAALAVVSVIFSWILVHTIFMLKYAREYYREPVGGMDFHDDERPQYSDFAYLAFTVGMTFQVSDTDLHTKATRRLALRHALISFPLGTVIIATSVNLVAGLAK